MQTADISKRETNRPENGRKRFPLEMDGMGDGDLWTAWRRETPAERRQHLVWRAPWTGSNPDAKENLPKVRQLILEGKIPEAEELLRTAFSGNPQSQHPYQKAGDVEIRHMGLWKDWGFGGPKGPEEYTEV